MTRTHPDESRTGRNKGGRPKLPDGEKRDDNFDNQISDYEHVSMSRPEDLIQDRTSFEQMVLYANEMMYKIENVRNLVLNEID